MYCDVLIGIGEGTRINRLSSTLRERVFEVARSHRMAFDFKTKSVEEHNEFVKESQKFCADQM